MSPGGRRVAAGGRARRALMRSSALLPVAFALFGASSAFGQAVNLGRAAGNAIIPDGRTATTLSGNGRVTNITTTTLRGGNAYNSFSQFREARGNVVNLVVPNAARNLVNVVTDGPVDIQGALNSYKNGVIGGNVVFADSYGFIVGKTGVVNVGALTVVTPAKSALDKLISANGAIDSKVANQIIHGDVPLSPDGSVSISGQIVAQHGVRINAHDVAIAGSVPEAERVARQKALFESTVNAIGLREGGAIVARHGGIEIVATNNIGVDGSLAAGGSRRHAASISLSAGHSVSIGASAKIRATGRNSHVAIAAGDDVAIAGAIAAKAAPGESAGRIDVSAAGDVNIADSAMFDAAGAGLKANGGTISIKPSGNLDVADGAAFDAGAGAFGEGGLVELSAGKAATLLLDPWDLQIGGVAAGGSSTASDVTVDSSFSPSLVTHGASVVLEADHSITIANGGVIDTTLSGGQSVAIALTAPSITVQGGAQLLADAVGGGTAGAITLKAIANAASAGVAQIEIGDTSGSAAIVKGGDILLQATATLAQATDHAIIAINSAGVTAAGTLQAQATASGGTTVNAVAAVASADVQASVDIIGSSTVTSGGAMTLASAATASASATGALPSSISLAADASAAVATVTSLARTHIGGASNVSTTGGADIELSATNTVTSSATANASGASAGASVAVNIVRATTSASVDGAASVNAAGALSLQATSSTSVAANAAASSGGASSAPDSSSITSQYLNDPNYAPYESTSDGKVSATGALAVADLVSSTTASMSSSNQATAGGLLTLAALASNSSASSANASAADGATGIGAALALNLVHVSNDATLDQSVQ